MEWQKKASLKRDALLQSIPNSWRIKSSEIPPPSSLRNVTSFITRYLSPLEQTITSATPITILQNIESFIWSAFEVTEAFCHRAALAHQLTNCLAEICFADALERARELDVFQRENGRLVGEWHGLPVSVKDRLHVRGLDSSCGYVSWLAKPMAKEDEGIIVQRLRESGAIIFVKTNVPMSMLIGETTNNIVGSTINPYNRLLTAGGASGGEGALLALRGSPIGWGSDIAGSIRIPSSFCNLYGLRPSYGRISSTGIATSLPGLPTAQSVLGPMCSDLDSLTSAVKWAINSRAWQTDPDVIDMPWAKEKLTNTLMRMSQPGQSNGSLIFAVMNSDEAVRPHPPMQRALAMVTAALRQRGYEVIEWKPPAHELATDVFFSILGSTAGEAIRNAVRASGEPPIPQIANLFEDESAAPSQTSEFWTLCEQRDDFRRQYQAYWRSTCELTSSKRPVDGVILPVAPHTATPEQLFTYYAYSAVPACLDFTTGSVPVTFADPMLDRETVKYNSLGPKDLANQQMYRAETFGGAPVGVQVMGQRLQEEKVLGMMGAVKAALEEYQVQPIGFPIGQGAIPDWNYA